MQIDLAGIGKAGFQPQVKVLKEWEKTNHSYRINLHTVPIDGKLYFSLEEVAHDTTGMVMKISPDENNLNELWQPVPNCSESKYELQKYNRWGERIFSSENTGWNGKLRNGQPAPEGVYLYNLQTFHPDKKSSYFQGTLHLLK